MPFYIINSIEIAQELFNKRAKINSDRKMGYMIMELYVSYLIRILSFSHLL